MENDPYSLNLLRDIVEPPPVSFWPPALGIWIVVALVLLWATVLAIICFLRWRRNAYRRVAMCELKMLEPRLASAETRLVALQELACLLKRVALAAYPRERVASLSGERWLRFLDEASARYKFRSPTGKMFIEAIYEPVYAAQVSQVDCAKLASASRQWIRSHRASRGVPPLTYIHSADNARQEGTR